VRRFARASNTFRPLELVQGFKTLGIIN